ncbi:carboxy terminal-processing peptidase [Flavobacterium sp. SUN046]|uniref:S41 family peptidase n=1 Tax=Flavobacterium sp. SUN046 TaxID=3002440 RepID=UPI002DB95800|nr:carboxy terminal-processing peptidase [Flavobacterium sp. SUN046]MEC4048426.1 carboxy terminal-processing peptidase [Flavobacterium sp. SUN046]
MKKSFLLIALIPILVFSQSKNNACITLSKINAIIQEKHYRPKPVNDSLSKYVFSNFLSALDENNRLFLEAEINALKKHQYQIDDYILNQDCDFLNDFYVAYNKAIVRYSELIESLRKETFAYSGTEPIEFSKNAFPYAKDEKELKHIFKKRIIFYILKDLAETTKNKDSIVSHFDAMAKIARDKTFEAYSCKTTTYQLSKEEFEAKFFSVFCSYFDPHTEYLSQSERSSFLSSVSADNLSFGLYLSMNEKDELVIDDIIAGSSASFTEKIDKGDQIIKIKYKDVEYPIACSSMKKIEEIISSSDYKIADFTIRKQSGEIITLSLNKMVLKDYDNKVYSFILNKNDKHIGYLKIPSFYATFENGKTNVSDDVLHEIAHLQQVGLDGLIIDLQNDGGGSMQEAIKVTGLFIEPEAIALMNNRKGKNEIIRDFRKGILYSGPLVVMINGFSASASEFFTNTIQDYNRGIIIGNTSHGKASMQRIYPLTNEENPQEYLKLTIERFYRITGKSNQTIGITPDIEIPCLFEQQMPRESDNVTALKNDQISSPIKFIPFNLKNKEQLITDSQKRIKEDKSIQEVVELNKQINKMYDDKTDVIPLNFDCVFEQVTEVNNLWAAIKKITDTTYALDATYTPFDIESMQFDTYLKTSNTEKLKELKSNVHVLEALNIVEEYLRLNKYEN